MDHGNLLTLSIHFAKIPTSPQNFAKHRGTESCTHSYTEYYLVLKKFDINDLFVFPNGSGSIFNNQSWRVILW